MIEVKVVKVPSVVKNVALEDGSTVNTALETACVDVPTNHKVTVNGDSQGTSFVLSDGDKIIIAKGAKGNL